MAETSKAELVRAHLADGKLTTREISIKAGCSVDYVRAVKQRMLGGGLGKADRKYREANAEKIKAQKRARNKHLRETNPDYKERRAEAVRLWRAKNPDKVNAYSRTSYHKRRAAMREAQYV